METNAIIRSFLALLQLSYRRSQLRIMEGETPLKKKKEEEMNTLSLTSHQDFEV